MADSSARRRGATRALALASLSWAALGANAAGCLDRPIAPIEPRTTSTVGERLTQSGVDKIDLVLAIDNSQSMADKQAILSKAVPDLVKGLVNPRCVDAAGAASATQPKGPTEDCPAGTKREFRPILDIHIGVVSSSLGGHGSDACPAQTKGSCDEGVNRTNDDHGHLVARADVYAKSSVPTYEDGGFLAWDPEQKLTPPGEKSIETLGARLGAIVDGVGQSGCGFESQLESWYRFLVDPEPYQSIAVVNGRATPSGIDEALLAERAAFLRSDSLLAILMLTDENDASIKETGQSYLAAELANPDGSAFHMPRPRAECAKDPSDPCCKSCGQPQGACPDDPTCFVPGSDPPVLATLDADSDPVNLRAWDDKRRFGVDFLYPVDRYVRALTEVQIPNRAGELVPNPIFSQLDPKRAAGVRDASLVFLAGIVGVPWQDIARKDDQGRPDLVAGLDAKGKAVGGFQSAAELSAAAPSGKPSTWDVVLGTSDGSTYRPGDPLMQESIDPRTGANPATGAALAPPGSPAGANPINGHEHARGSGGDLQYACIFPLPTPRDCTASCAAERGCDCTDLEGQSPLCDASAGDSGAPTLQARAKAYPGLRELGVLRGVGENGIVASICPKQLDDATRADYGYRPAIGAIIDRLKVALGHQCLPRSLTPDAAGHVPCVIVEARKTGGACPCDGAARQAVSTEHHAAEAAAREDPIAAAAGWDCFCEIAQASGPALAACQGDASDAPVANGAAVDGWCYVDATTTPATGDPKLVEDCPTTERRLVRFVGKGAATEGATLFITCSGE